MPDSKQSETNWVDRIELGIALVLQIGIVVAVVGEFIQGEWRPAFAGTVVLVLSFAPAIIEKRLRVPLPTEFTLATCIFLYASFALGEMRDFYERIWWWDLALHGLSAMMIGTVGFLSVYVFYMTNRIRIAPLWIATITFAIAVTVGTLWEIFEFLMDNYFGLNMQKSGLPDTMTDLTINSAGAMVAAVIAYLYVRDRDSQLIKRLIRVMVANKLADHDS